MWHYNTEFKYANYIVLYHTTKHNIHTHIYIYDIYTSAVLADIIVYTHI